MCLRAGVSPPLPGPGSHAAMQRSRPPALWPETPASLASNLFITFMAATRSGPLDTGAKERCGRLQSVDDHRGPYQVKGLSD